tara:strand:+ start:127 stop:915 length:789 start_codon:yes stop_codon:yes gene_type:complete
MNEPIFIHSDVGKSISSIKSLGFKVDTKNLQQSIYDFLISFAKKDASRLIFPAFNYNYGNTQEFKVLEDEIEVGSLPTWVYKTQKFNRTAIPFYSVLSINELGIESDNLINPFGDKSFFQKLYEKDGKIFFLGAPFSSNTFIHFVEEMVNNGPIYRYKKRFDGKIIFGNIKKNVLFEMHVRPKNTFLDYDWDRLERELIENNLLKKYKGLDQLKLIKARELFSYWKKQIENDPFYLLNDFSKEYMFKATDKGTKRLELEDFE